MEHTKRKRLAKRRRLAVFSLILFLIFAGGLAAGYLYLSRGPVGSPSPGGGPEAQTEQGSSYLKIYYPVRGYLQMEERLVTPEIQDREEAARDTVTEYLKGPAGMADPAIPPGAKLRGLYFGTNGILYVDLSETFKSNFQGDALTEYLLLRGLYESLLSNVQGITDVMVLIDGRETGSIGGHILADRPLSGLAITNAAGNGKGN